MHTIKIRPSTRVEPYLLLISHKSRDGPSLGVDLQIPKGRWFGSSAFCDVAPETSQEVRASEVASQALSYELGTIREKNGRVLPPRT